MLTLYQINQFHYWPNNIDLSICKIYNFLNYQVDRIRFDTQGSSHDKFRDNLLTKLLIYTVIL
jgi:hypothetical protein